MTSSTVVRLARSPAPVTLSCRMNKITTARSLLCNRSLHTTARVLLASPIQVPPAAAKSANKTTADNPAGIHLWDRLPGEGGKPRRGMAKIRGPLRESRFRLVTDGNKPEVNPRKVNEFDVAIVGGGIIGMATAREILKRFPKMTLAVLEKEREVAAHQTGHNSGVIHAGMYYVPGTTMAYTCVRGNALMYEYCEQHDLPVERCGKLIVATSKDEHPTVEMLYNQGVKNGVQGLEILDSKGIQEKEPNVRGYSALYSPNTGICDYQMVTECMAREVTASGRAEIKLACEALDFKETEDGRVAVTVVEPGQKGPKFDVTARNVITCAGFYADRLAAKAGGDKSLARISTFRGQYYQIKQASTIRAVGTHITPTMNGRRGHGVIIGPGSCITFAREGYRFFDFKLRDIIESLMNPHLWSFVFKNFRMSMNELYRDLNARTFVRSGQKLIPSLRANMVENSFAGVMGQIFGKNGEAVTDYVLERKTLNGKVLNIRNAPSPACTASLAIAEIVTDAAQEDFNWSKDMGSADFDLPREVPIEENSFLLKRAAERM